MITVVAFQSYFLHNDYCYTIHERSGCHDYELKNYFNPISYERSGGHDYEGLSYTTSNHYHHHEPFIIIDLFNLRYIAINLKEFVFILNFQNFIMWSTDMNFMQSLFKPTNPLTFCNYPFFMHKIIITTRVMNRCYMKICIYNFGCLSLISHSDLRTIYKVILEEPEIRIFFF